MRIGSQIAMCAVLAFSVGVVHADTTTKPRSPQQTIVMPAPKPVPRAPRALPFATLDEQVDNRVLANLLSNAKAAHPNDFPLIVMPGPVGGCQEATCVVPLTIRVVGATGPVSLAFAVANPKGELSQIHHAECGTGACSVSLVLERGTNAISIGAVDGVVKATAYRVILVHADRVYAKRGRTEWF